MSKNLTRTIIVLLSCIIAISVWDNLDKFLSLVGSFTSIPIAFILPSAFHYKACAETTAQKAIDLFLLILSIFLMFFCTFFVLYTWNDE